MTKLIFLTDDAAKPVSVREIAETPEAKYETIAEALEALGITGEAHDEVVSKLVNDSHAIV